MQRGRPQPQQSEGIARTTTGVAQLTQDAGAPAGPVRYGGGSRRRGLRSKGGISGPGGAVSVREGPSRMVRRASEWPLLTVEPGRYGCRWTRRFIYCSPAVRLVSDGRAYPRSYASPPRYRSAPIDEAAARRSHAAVPVAVAIILVGLYLGEYTFLAPGLLGLALLVSGFSFLSTRVNPLSPHFYLTRKPSWAAVGVVFLGALLLLGDAYSLFPGAATVPHLFGL